MKFFFDNNLAIKLAHGLDQMVSPNHRVVHLRDEFLPNVEDAVWMTGLAKEEDVVIITAPGLHRRSLNAVGFCKLKEATKSANWKRENHGEATRKIGS